MQIPGYQIERELGQGGMAIVYLAIQESLRRRVALKVIKPILTTDGEFAIRFLREGRLIAQLNDPHIVTVYDIASHEGTYYLSMEYLGGGTLQQRIRAGLSPSEVLIISRAIVSALSYAHERGIIHRDIKPQNILFRENGTPVLTDFGIAKTLGSNTIMTRTGLSIGTPRYMSPEQIRGQEVDARADLYSFGVLFYEMLTGNVPYAAEDSFALAMMHVTAATPELPPRLSTYQPLLNKLLDKDPERRFQSGQDFITALDALEAGRTDELLRLTSLDSPTASAGSRTGQPRKFAWKTGMAAAVVVLVGAVAGGGTYLYLQQPTPIPPPLTDTTAPPTPPVTDTAAQQREVAEQQLIEARQQRQAGALEEALAHTEEGLRQAPYHTELLALRKEINQQLAEARAQGEQQQIELQAEQLLEQAQRAQQEDKLDISLVYIEQGLRAMPTHNALLALKQEVLARKTAHEQQEEGVRQQAETEQRQAEQRQTEERQLEERQRQAEEFLARALDDQRNQAYESSLLQIEQGLQQVPKHPRLLALRTEVRNQLRAAKNTSPTPTEDTSSQVASLLRECNAHLRANRLTMGRGGNAADCYSEVLKLDRGNTVALAGLDKIADRYSGLAASAIQGNHLDRARGLIERLESFNPNYSRLPRLREQLASAQTSVKPTTPLPTQPESESNQTKPASPPPLDLISTPQSTETPPATETKTEVITEDRHTSIAKTETADNISLHKTVSPQGLLNDADHAAPPPSQRNMPAQLLVRADVDDAEVWINNKKVGTTPLAVNMPPGSYRVKVQQKGYGDWNGRVKLAAGEESTLSAILPKKLEAAVTTPASKPEPAPESKPEPKPEPTPESKPEPKPESSSPSSQKAQTASSTPASSGCLDGNCQNGEGTYRYPDGSQYTGQFRSAQMHGQGTYIYAGRSEKYSGEWRNGAINGQGSYYYRSGNRYEGQWRNGRKDGQGAYYYADSGDKYVGDFANDRPNGQGVYYYSNGNRYEGAWHNGRKNGQGTLYESGRTIVGEWENDQMVRVRIKR